MYFEMQRTAQPRGGRSLLRCVLSAYLVVFLGLASTFELAHLASDDHGHSYCDEHHQFEEIPRGTSARQVPSKATSIETGSVPLANGVSRSGCEAHVACAFLGCSALHALLLVPAQAPATVAADRSATLEGVRQRGFSSSLLLLSAPKTSPPVAAG
jgi:hypothetical protein